MNYWEKLLQIESIRKDEVDPVKEYVNNKHVTTSLNTVAKNIITTHLVNQ